MKAVVEREIERLEAIGKVRPLDNGETIQLAKLIHVEQKALRRKRQYDEGKR